MLLSIFSNFQITVAGNCRIAKNNKNNKKQKMSFIQLTFISILIHIASSAPSPSAANVFLLPSTNSPLKSSCAQVGNFIKKKNITS